MAQHNNKSTIDNITKLNKLTFAEKLLSYFGAKIEPKTLGTQGRLEDVSYEMAPSQKFDPKDYIGKNPEEQLDDIMNQTKLSDGIKELYKEWADDVQIGYDNFQERLDRVNALTFLYCNDSYIKSSTNLTAMEVSKSSETNVFTVSSEDVEWDKKTNYLINKVWGYSVPMLYDIAFNIYLYADAWIGNEVNSAGIVSRQVLKISDVLEKMEFDPMHVASFVNEMKSNKQGGFTVNNFTGFNSSSGFNAMGNGATIYTNANAAEKGNNGIQQHNYKSRSELLKDYLNNLSDTAAEEFFTPHLLGYRIAGDRMLAPWQISHIRYGEKSSEFYPYGCPALLPCVSYHLQEQRINGLEDIRKRLSLPLTQWEVDTGSEGMSRQFQMINMVKQRYENMGLAQSTNAVDFPNLINNVWTAKGLVTVTKTAPGEGGNADAANAALKRLDDKKMICTLVPKTYVDPSTEGFQMSGVALMQLFAPYRDLVENIRDLITKDCEDAIQLHYAILGEKVPEHTLTLNVINPNDDQALNGKLELAGKVLEKVAQILGVEAKELPSEIKADILARFGGLDPVEIEKWQKLFAQIGPEEEKAPEMNQEDLEGGFGDDMGGADFSGGGIGGADEGGEDTGGAEEAGPAEESSKRKHIGNHLLEAKKQLLLETYQSIKEDVSYQKSIKLDLMRKFHIMETTHSRSMYFEKIESIKNLPSVMENDAIRFFRSKSGKKAILNEKVREERKLLEEWEDGEGAKSPSNFS